MQPEWIPGCSSRSVPRASVGEALSHPVLARPQPPPAALPGSTGSYEEAGAPLQEALRPTPPPEAARARRGLLQLKKGQVAAAVRDLQGLAETDARDLRFLLRLLDGSERHSVTQVRRPRGNHTGPSAASRAGTLATTRQLFTPCWAGSSGLGRGQWEGPGLTRTWASAHLRPQDPMASGLLCLRCKSYR